MIGIGGAIGGREGASDLFGPHTNLFSQGEIALCPATLKKMHSWLPTQL
jgi:hypothetical protein